MRNPFKPLSALICSALLFCAAFSVSALEVEDVQLSSFDDQSIMVMAVTANSETAIAFEVTDSRIDYGPPFADARKQVNTLSNIELVQSNKQSWRSSPS